MGFLMAVVSGFAGGIFFRSIFVFGWPVYAFLLLLAAIFITARFLTSRRAYTLGAAFCIFLALGMLRAALAESPLPQSFASQVGERVSFEGIVVGDPDVRDKNQRVEIRVTQNGETTTMLAVAPRAPEVAVGERVRVSGTLEVPEPFADDNGRIFRYDKYLERDGVRFLLSFAYLRVERPAPWYSLPAFLARVKHVFLDGIAATLPEPYASLASGIVIGGKSGLGSELKEAFTRSGLIHMVVLSGHNVMIVASWVIAIFTFLSAKVVTVSHRRVPRGVIIGLGALALVAFVGIAGASATAIRAALMALIALYARATGRTYAASRALFLVIFLMLLFNPLYLVFDPGFGLSVAATAGLIWLAPAIENWMEFGTMRLRRMMDIVSPSSDDGLTMSKHGFWKNAFTTTLAAQTAVFPLLLYFTGNLSVVAIPANLLVMPVIPLASPISRASRACSLDRSLRCLAWCSLSPHTLRMRTWYSSHAKARHCRLPLS